MKRIVVTLIGSTLFAVLAVACGTGGPSSLGLAPGSTPTGNPSTSPTPSTGPTSTGSPSASPAPSPGPPFTFEVWFTRGGQLFEVSRTEPLVPGIGRLAVSRAIAGPSLTERAASVESAIPPATPSVAV